MVIIAAMIMILLVIILLILLIIIENDTISNNINTTNHNNKNTCNNSNGILPRASPWPSCSWAAPGSVSFLPSSHSYATRAIKISVFKTPCLQPSSRM